MARPSLKIVSAAGAPPAEPPTPALTGVTVTLTPEQRHAWSELSGAYFAVSPTFAGIATTDTKLAWAPSQLDRLSRAVAALRETVS